MSIKSLSQIFILFLIILIIGGVYFKYFEGNTNIVEEVNLSSLENSDQLKNLENKISELEIKNKQLNEKIKKKNDNIVEVITNDIDQVKEIDEIENKNLNNINVNDIKKKDEDYQIKKEIVNKKKEIKNLVKDVEYISVDQKGNRFHLFANSGKSNVENKNVLDLENVRGEIKSEYRDNIYIYSDFAQYNSINLNSKFYENVIIEYQDKKITCVNFDINMETNKAFAYNNVIITDPQSIMKAGIVEFDLTTKDININPKTVSTGIEIITN